MTTNDKNIDIFEYDCSENNDKLWEIKRNDEQWPKMTKTLTFLNMIAAKIMTNDNKWPRMTKNDKTIDIFEYDCSENNEKI